MTASRCSPPGAPALVRPRPRPPRPRPDPRPGRGAGRRRARTARGRARCCGCSPGSCGPTAGEVRVLGPAARRRRAEARGRSDCCRTSRCSTTTSRCAENLTFAARLYGLDRPADAARARARGGRPRGTGGRPAAQAEPRACSSAPRSRGRCCTARGCCCWTSRSPRSTPPSAERLRADLERAPRRGAGARGRDPPSGGGVGRWRRGSR